MPTRAESCSSVDMLPIHKQFVTVGLAPTGRDRAKSARAGLVPAHAQFRQRLVIVADAKEEVGSVEAENDD